MNRYRPGTLLLALLLLLITAACDDGGGEIIITSTPGAGGSATATASTTPARTGTLTVTSTATRTSTATTPAGTATSTPGAPAGYAASCAAGYPWGSTVSGPFVCIDTPDSAVELEDSVRLTGYAGGSFENNVIIEIRDASNVTLAQQAVTYTSPGPGMPGAWQVTMPVPPGQPSEAPGRIVARFASPRDGGTVAVDSIEVRFR